jgi:hypothetical protein
VGSVTFEERRSLQIAIDRATRDRVEAEIACRGVDRCFKCDTPILDQRPRKRFCSENCRSAAWDQGYKDRLREQRRLAA